MSKNMQITVTIQPYYTRDFEGSYPKLALALKSAMPDLITQDPSLYKLAGLTDKLLYHSDGTPLREILIQHKDELKKTYAAIQEDIADWNLSKADKLLYGLEDIFEGIESELD